MYKSVAEFYWSNEYKKFARYAKIKSNGKCAHCGNVCAYSFLRAHHTIELTLENVNDPTIALNLKNIEVICHDCHNRVHRRYTSIEHKVYLVCGAPLAGKTTYVETVATRYDLVLDLDKIHESICIATRYDKPAATKSIAFDIRQLILDRIRMRKGEWENAYIIGCYPKLYERDTIIKLYGAEVIHIDTSKDVCIKRAYERSDNMTIVNNQIDYIEKYFSDYN